MIITIPCAKLGHCATNAANSRVIPESTDALTPATPTTGPPEPPRHPAPGPGIRSEHTGHRAPGKAGISETIF